MISERIYQLGAAPNAIRELFAYGLARKAEIGQDNVFDFSIGSPSVPAPDEIRQSIIRLLDEPPCELHGYTPSPGDMRVRTKVAEHISRRFKIEARAQQVYLTAGAAAGLAISICAITTPGEEVIVISPYFPEYKVWTETAQCTCIEVPAHEPDFQLDVPAVEKAITAKTAAVIINSPNNPTGVVYTRQILEKLCAVLAQKEQEFGRMIYLISDEPYREIVYGADVPYMPHLYPHTIVCHSFSKNLSLPGERIGYIYVSDTMNNAEETSIAISGAGRALGFICASTLFQRVIEQCIDVMPDIKPYQQNLALLTEGLKDIGYEFVQPEGAFYLWVRSLEPDACAFHDRAKQHELLLVPGSSFGTDGWVRVGYCVTSDMIRSAMPAFKALFDEYQKD